MEIIFKKLTEVAITNGKILNKQNDYEKNIISRQCKKTFCNSEKLENICHTKITLTTKPKCDFGNFERFLRSEKNSVEDHNYSSHDPRIIIIIIIITGECEK